MNISHNTWIELSESDFHHNIASLKKLAGDSKMAISVKANAYGHGLKEIVLMANNSEQIDYLTVHSVSEAVFCRDYGWNRNLLLLGPFLRDEIQLILQHNIEPTIFELQQLEQLAESTIKQAMPVKTHLKLETGTNRQGVRENQLEQFADMYKKHDCLQKPFGVSMHFANVEDSVNYDYTTQQLDAFEKMLAQLKDLGISPTLVHSASSAAMILFENTRFDMVRPGIAVYGCWPSKETKLSYDIANRNDKELLKPLLAWKSRVTHIKDVDANSFIGYGCNYKTTKPTKIAVVPVGYADGYSRSLSGKAYVLINGQRAEVRGRVCMNLTMVDVSEIPNLTLGDVVTLLGVDQNESIRVEQLADWSDTINYEFLARLSPLLPRIVKS